MDINDIHLELWKVAYELIGCLEEAHADCEWEDEDKDGVTGQVCCHRGKDKWCGDPNEGGERHHHAMMREADSLLWDIGTSNGWV